MKRIDKIVFERMPERPPKDWYELWNPHILDRYGVPEPRGPADLHLGSLLEFDCMTCGEQMCEGHWGFIDLPDALVEDPETSDVREFHILNPLFEDKMTWVPVLPNADREITLNAKYSMVDDTTLIYNDILNILEKWQLNKDVQYPIIIWEDIMRVLQFEVDLLFDNRDNVQDLRGRHIMGIIDKLKGKGGHLRRVCLGKRMNSSARTVFTVNPRLDIDEINVPQDIADILTVDLPVTEENVSDPRIFEVRDTRTNRYFKSELWIPTRMPNLSEEDRANYRLVRHLKDGDIVVHGRQPSLHRMSQLAHYVKIWPHKTLAINPACCLPETEEILDKFGRPKLIKDFKVGDSVLTYGESGLELGKVTKTFQRTATQDEIWWLNLTGYKNAKIWLTEEHPILSTSGEWLSPKDIDEAICVSPYYDWRMRNDPEETRKFKKANDPEAYRKEYQRPGRTIGWADKRVISVVEKYELSLEFTGDGKFWVEYEDGNMCPDFVATGRDRMIVEVYKHAPSDTNYYQWRLKKYTELGYNCLGIKVKLDTTDKEIRDQILKWLHNGVEFTKMQPDPKNSNTWYGKYQFGARKEFEVYNIEVEPNNNYIHGTGVVLHNCKPLNADCDGDATWIWVPQSEETRKEAREILLASKNIISPRTNKPIIRPEQDFRTQEYLETGENKEYRTAGEINELIHRESRTMLGHGITFDKKFMKVITHKAGSRGNPAQYKQMYEEGLKGRSSFTKGLNPTEFWDHAIEGRRSVMDIKLGVPKTGYMQRKLIFALGDMRVTKDGKVRDAQDNLVSEIDFRDKFPVGTFVGIIAAQSLGEASTQTMLRSKHTMGETDVDTFEYLNWLLTSYTEFDKEQLLEELKGFWSRQNIPFDENLLRLAVDAKFMSGEESGLSWGYILKNKPALHALGFERVRQTIKSLPGRTDNLQSPFSQVIVGSYREWLKDE